jgi:carbonic anhydrase/SulP family sulfate permease
VLGSIEYGCAVAGAKLVLVMGHTRCGAVTTAVKTACSTESVADLTGCQHVEHVLRDIQETIDMTACARLDEMSPGEQEEFINEVVRANVLRTVQVVRERSSTLDRLAEEGKIAIVGTIYDVVTGDFTFWTDELADQPALIAQGDGQPQTNS